MATPFCEDTTFCVAGRWQPLLLSNQFGCGLAQAAREAVQRLDEFKVGKNNIRVTLFDDFARYANVPEEYRSLEQAPPAVLVSGLDVQLRCR